MSTVAIIILTAVLSIGASAIGFTYFQSRKEGEQSIPWENIRPIISEMFTEVINIVEADKIGYSALEDYAVDYIARKVRDASFLTTTEKELLGPELIRSLISPRLKEIYNSKESS